MHPLFAAAARRFYLAVGAGIVSSILVWYGKIDGAVYATIVIATVAAYITGGMIKKKDDTAAEE